MLLIVLFAATYSRSIVTNGITNISEEKNAVCLLNLIFLNLDTFTGDLLPPLKVRLFRRK